MRLEEVKRKIFSKNLKMKCLTIYIIINLLYILISSYLVTVKQIKYINMSKEFVPLLIINVIVGIIICVKGYYKKKYNTSFYWFSNIFGNYINNIRYKSPRGFLGV